MKKISAEYISSKLQISFNGIIHVRIACEKGAHYILYLGVRVKRIMAAKLTATKTPKQPTFISQQHRVFGRLAWYFLREFPEIFKWCSRTHSVQTNGIPHDEQIVIISPHNYYFVMFCVFYLVRFLFAPSHTDLCDA